MGGRRSEVLSSQVVNSVQRALARLSEIWDALGIADERRVERVEVVRRHTEELLLNMISEEEFTKASVEQGIVSQRAEVLVLCRELGTEENEPELQPGIMLLQQDKGLRLRLQELRAVKEERLLTLRSLQGRDQALCAQLCATPYYVPSGAVPSEEQLRELEEQVLAREQERDRRAKACAHTCAQIKELLRVTGEGESEQGPEEDGEEEDLSPGHLQALQDQLQQVRGRREVLLGALEGLQEQVNELWQRLGTEEPEEQCFRKQVADAKGLAGQLLVWEKELDRLKEKKRAQLKEVTLKARQELELYWDKCHYTAEQRAAFSPFHSSDFTEELLSQHDQEVVRVKMDYERCRALLEAAGRWDSLWARFMELETNANNPNRFNNRGGALLKEGQERARVLKLLSKLEEEMRREAETWEVQQGSSFLLKGRRLQDYVGEHWEEHKRQREREKANRGKGETPLKRPAPSSAPAPSNKTRKVISAPTKHVYPLGCHN
ncbi:protein regulator of cytokinesis 1-like [Pleurodeles waltl]|uniref:protein regulator of cytokinesis 1-like n=1 Tax=Pleurodeles waltl TaxID=8319 RepID=UPI0037096036